MRVLGSFSRQLAGAFVLLIVVLSISGGWGLRWLARSAKEQAAAAKSYVADLVLAERLRSGVERAVAAGRGYLVAGDRSFIDREMKDEAEVHETLRQIADRVHSQEGTGLVTRISDLHAAYEQTLEQVIALKTSGAGATEIARKFEDELVPKRRQLDTALDALIGFRERELAEEYDHARSQVVRTVLLAASTLAFGVLMSGVLALILSRHLSRQYQREHEAVRSAQRAISARNELLGIVAHDLRSPLTAIVMKAASLRKGSASDAGGKQAVSIENIAMRMEYLIKSLLDAASLEEGHLSLSVEHCRVAALLHETIALLGSAASAKSVRLELQVSSPDLAVRADRERVLQVLSNLVGNAIKFAPEGSAVEIRCEQAAGAVRFAISDEGPGIVAENMSRVFERFWKAEVGGKQGTGLGLYIAKGIVDAHGGQIWVESEPGHGAAFFFTLPESASLHEPPSLSEGPPAHV